MTNENEWTIAVTGEMVSELPEEQRRAKIIEPAPSYLVEESGAPEARPKKIKMIVNVELTDGRTATYYPNMTSGRFIATKLKSDLTAETIKTWVGKTIFWGKILDMKVGGQDKKVLYVTDVQ